MLLEFMARQMQALELPYEYWRWTDADIPDVYFTGDASGTATGDEDRSVDGTFTLAGHSYKGELPLEQWHRKIRTHFADWVHGGGVAAKYAGFRYVPTDLEGLSRIEIDIETKEWG